MSAQIITIDDLRQFKMELFIELKDLFKVQPLQQKRWLKTYEVKDMLGISSGTLQTMRAKGEITYTKLRGLALYDYEDIVRMMESQKTGGKQAKNRY